MNRTEVVKGPHGRFRVDLYYKPAKSKKEGNPDTNWVVRTLQSISRWLPARIAGSEICFRSYADLAEATLVFDQEIERVTRFAGTPPRRPVPRRRPTAG